MHGLTVEVHVGAHVLRSTTEASLQKQTINTMLSTQLVQCGCVAWGRTPPKLEIGNRTPGNLNRSEERIQCRAKCLSKYHGSRPEKKERQTKGMQIRVCPRVHPFSAQLVREGLRGRARCVAPRASADAASAA